ncbi:translocation protein S66 [Onygenales sp. PD_40]|nr:translocation protein S66 [Onygenales sp. PD_40]KAK2784689.1 translocation protein S66 [Onygenales sp. PD_12]KAK2798783.1 translocation protein S66 [Onygenales sp. PD_10]
MVNWLSLSIPLAYLGILIGSLATFSSLYRKRKAAKSSSLTPWFPPHLQRDIYLSLLHLEPASTTTPGNKEKKPPAVPETVLKAALLRRATEDIRRLLELRSQKPALGGLLQKGSVGDDLWQRFLRAEKEMEDEVRDVVAEANAFAPNWGQTIFQSANEMAVNAVFRERVEELQSSVKEEREWWDRKKASIQEDFMKELEEDAAAAKKPNATATATKAAAPADKQSSDDDAVLVEGGGPAVGGGSAGGKKKKGKK